MQARDMDLRTLLGQKLIFGFQGKEPSEELLSMIREYKIGNVILFMRNVGSAEQLRALTRELRERIVGETGVLPFIVIDQEGGMVTRLPKDAVNVPSAMALAATGSEEAVTEAAEITIRQLRGLGPNFNMAPVLDVNSSAQNPVIGVRSLGDDAVSVGKLGASSARAYTGSGVLCCGKHFPGHGDTAVDSHLGLPVIDKTEEELERVELIPFRRAIEAGIPAIMVAHILFPRITDENVPSTMSRRIVTGLLREKLGFNGLILTDCMEMDAVKKYYGTANGVVAAVKAGVDLAEISNTASLMREAAEALNRAAENGELDMDEITSSVDRILAFKEQIKWDADACLAGRAEDFAATERLSARALTLVDGAAPNITPDTFFCGCADYRVTQAANDSGGGVPFPEYMAGVFGCRGVVTAKDPSEDEISSVVAASEGADEVVVGTCNAHLFTGQLRLVEAMIKAGRLVTVIALRNPYDLSHVKGARCRIAAFDYSLPAFRALEGVLRGGEMTGKSPVRL